MDADVIVDEKWKDGWYRVKTMKMDKMMDDDCHCNDEMD